MTPSRKTLGCSLAFGAITGRSCFSRPEPTCPSIAAHGLPSLPPAPAARLASLADDGPQSDAADDFDQTGFELPPCRAPRTDPHQVSLFPDYTGQADAPEGEPVFALTGPQAEPHDDQIQPDAPDSFGAQTLAPGLATAKLSGVSANRKPQLRVDSASAEKSASYGQAAKDQV